jgi:hypothetical protein
MKTRICASNDGHWNSWPNKALEQGGRKYRTLTPGQRGRIALPIDGTREALLVIVLAKRSPTTRPALPQIRVENQLIALIHKPKLPYLLWAVVPKICDSHGTSDTAVEIEAAASSGLAIQEILVLPTRGKFSRYWATPLRRLLSRLRGGPLPWSPVDFPYSHLDGNAYLRRYSSVRKAVIDGRFKTAAHYFYARGQKKGMPVLLAVDKEPNPGAIPGFVSSLLSEIKTTQTDIDVLLFLLDRAREELNQPFR